ncbi:MAG: metalloregulator ArsR/SmtB family transcription factor [Sphingobium sp.]|nr:metalloregulator ArsR/SmtB family transcription factor [Sphingobium sp.]MCP5398271.1 metalloregulator ArsR/SmtB family transcription factor [Sphingomonas sp.]
MTELLAIFRALADPTRMRIMRLLRAMELSVGEMAQAVAQSQPRVSRHVKILVEAGLIDRRKEGNWVFLRAASNSASRKLQALLDQVEPADSEQLWFQADLARLNAIRADRQHAANEYFAQIAEEWDAVRSLHISEGAVERAMAALLGDEAFDTLLDLGTGTGRMIELFGQDAQSVHAIDRSPDMLRMARAKLPATGGDKFNLILGDFCELPVNDGVIDLVTAHQILHYSPTPERAIAEAGRVLGQNGRLLIVDFAPHDYEELRTRDQHERLGFSDEQMGEWFRAAGLEMEKTETLPGGELTIKLWLGRRHGSVVTPIKGMQI